MIVGDYVMQRSTDCLTSIFPMHNYKKYITSIFIVIYLIVHNSLFRFLQYNKCIIYYQYNRLIDFEKYCVGSTVKEYINGNK